MARNGIKTFPWKIIHIIVSLPFFKDKHSFDACVDHLNEAAKQTIVTWEAARGLISLRLSAANIYLTTTTPNNNSHKNNKDSKMITSKLINFKKWRGFLINYKYLLIKNNNNNNNNNSADDNNNNNNNNNYYYYYYYKANKNTKKKSDNNKSMIT